VPAFMWGHFSGFYLSQGFLLPGSDILLIENSPSIFVDAAA